MSNALFTDLPGDDGMPGAQRRIALVMIVIATLMAVLDTSIVNIALPTIARDLHADPAASVWIVNAYQVSAAISLVAFAALGDVIGFRKVYVFGLVLFTATSFGCALSTNLTSLTLLRFMQGLGGSAIMSLGPALYRTVFPSRVLGTIFGWNALVVGAGTAAGPALGGAMLAVLPWPWLFAVNVPLGALAIVLARRVLPRQAGSRGAFDWPGALLCALAMAAFVVVVDGLAPPLQGWRELILLVVAGVAAWGFIFRQKRAPAPLLPLDIFHSARFSLAAATSFASFVGQGITFIALPFLFQNAFGYSALMSALLFTPWPLAIVFAGPFAGRLADRFSAALLSSAGLAVLTLGLALLAVLPAHASVPDILWRAFVCGLGFGFFQSPNNRELLGSVPRSRSGTASGILAMARTFGQSLGAAVVAIVLTGASLPGVRENAAATAGLATHISLWVAAAATLVATLFSIARIGRQHAVA